MVYLFFAAGLGLEPRLTAPKAAVLPLDDPAICYNIILTFFINYYFGSSAEGGSLPTVRQAPSEEKAAVLPLDDPAI